MTEGYAPYQDSALDGAKALAVLLLVVGHAAGAWPELPGIGAVSLPVGYAVIALFVLAGYMVTDSLFTEHEVTGGIAPWHFFARKLLRVMPTLAVFAAVTTIHQSFRGVDVPAERVFSLLGFVGNYYNGLALNDEHRHVVGHLWSIGVGAQFLVIWVFVMRWSLQRDEGRSLKPILAGVVTLAAVVRLAFLHMADVSGVYLYNATETRIDALAVGALLAVVIRDSSQERPVASLRTSRVTAGAALLLVAISVYADTEYRRGIGYTLEALLTALALGAVVLGRKPTGEPAARRRLGLFRGISIISYSLFVWHHYGLAFARKITPNNEFAVLALTVVVAAGAYLVLEYPFRRRAHRFRPPLRP